MPNTGMENTRPETKPDLHNTFHIAVPVAKKKAESEILTPHAHRAAAAGFIYF